MGDVSVRRFAFGYIDQPSGRILVVGGNARKCGKTSLAVAIMHSFPDAHWVAVKISSHVHGGCPIHGASCACGTNVHTFAFNEERKSIGGTDTSRFLAAGATRALWLQVKPGRLADAWPRLCSELEGASHVILESNTAASFLRTFLYLVVLDLRRPDFKSSLISTIDLTDAFILRASLRCDRPQIDLRQLRRSASFIRTLGSGLSAGLRQFILRRFFMVALVPKRYHYRLFS